jgi:preprotein translocase subunit SecE
MVTTGMVMLMVVFASLFFLVVDELLRIAVALALGIGRGG